MAAADLDPCGTWRALAPDAKGGRSALAVRPPDGTLKVFSPHFVVHYYGDSLDTYAQSVADAAEQSYRVLVDTLSHLPPLPDGTAGGDARTDIYLRPWTVMGSAYGTTYPETNVGAPYPNSYTAWVELVDTMGTARRVTITAHEFYHTIQVVYDRFENVSLLEMFSMWVQERVYDQYNLHYPTLNLFFRQPHRGLFSQTYTNVPWAIYLTEKYGDGIMRETLDECAAVPGGNAPESFDAALQTIAGTNFHDAFVDFGTFNYFVGKRDDGAHYSEGANYYTTTREHRTLCFPEPLVTSSFPPAELGANYVLLDGDNHSGPLMLYFFPEFLANTILTMTRFQGATQIRTTREYAAFGSPLDSIPINDWPACDSLLLVYQVEVGGPNNTLGYMARHTRAAVPATDWFLVFDRDVCRTPFDGFLDEFDDRDSEENPIAYALRDLGATMVVEDVLPADLTGCGGIFVVGGFDGTEVKISDADLVRLNEFMDGGGDVYVESSRLGELIDPSLGAGNATQQAFWSRFSCSFAPGSASGNLTAWSTNGNPFMATHQFTYDTGAPNSYVGKLTPIGNAGFLARDGGGNVRATAIRAAGGSSTRIMSTLLLGGSTGSGSTRAGYLNDVLTLFGTNVAALAVTNARISVNDHEVSIDGTLEHFDERALSLVRIDTEGRHDVALTVTRTGGLWRFTARDHLTTASATYQLVDVENQRVLWTQRAEARTPVYTLRLTGIYPNPARDGVRIALDSPSDANGTLGVYDVAGRLVAREAAPLKRGANVLFLQSLPVTSGVYFVQVDAPAGSVRGRLLVLR